MTQNQQLSVSANSLNVPSLVAWRLKKERARLQASAVHRQLLDQLHTDNSH